MKTNDGRAEAVNAGAHAYRYTWHVVDHHGGEMHVLTIGDPYPIIVATVGAASSGRWLVTAHRHLDPSRHQRAHARTLSEARKIAELLTNNESLRLANLRNRQRQA